MVPSWPRCGPRRSIAAARQPASLYSADNPAGIINWYQCWNNRIWRWERGLRSTMGGAGAAPGAAHRAEGGAVTLLRGGAVKRVALTQDTAERANDVLHFDRRHISSVGHTRCSREG